MESVNTWIAVAVGVITVLAGMAAMLRGVVHALDGRIDSRLDARLGPLERRTDARLGSLEHRMDERFGSLERRMDERFDEQGRRMDSFDTELAHITAVVDLRLKPLEEDMALIKRHILGLPAA